MGTEDSSITVAIKVPWTIQYTLHVQNLLFKNFILILLIFASLF